MRCLTTIIVALSVVFATAVGVDAHPAVTPSLSASAKVVSFGQTVKVQGTVPGASAGEQVQILGAVCGFTGLVPVGETKTTTGGKYVYSLEPMLNATLYAQAGGGQSSGTRIQIRPAVQLRRIDRTTFAVDVSVGNGQWFTKPVTLQRFDVKARAWKPLGKGSLKANSDPTAIVAVSSATVRASVPRGTQLRAVVSQATVGSCYLPGASSTLTA